MRIKVQAQMVSLYCSKGNTTLSQSCTYQLARKAGKAFQKGAVDKCTPAPRSAAHTEQKCACVCLRSGFEHVHHVSF